MEECEFCGRKVKKVGCTSMTGCYCRSCLELVIFECEGAISKITGKPYKRKEPKRQSLNEAKREEELKELLQGMNQTR